MRHEQPGDPRLQFVMPHSSIGTCLLAPDGSVLEVNDALCTLLGRERAVLCAATWNDLTHPDDLAAEADLAREVVDGSRNTYRLPQRYLRPDGSVVRGDLFVAAVRRDDGTVDHLIHQVVELSDEPRARHHLRALAESAGDDVGFAGIEGTRQVLRRSDDRLRASLDAQADPQVFLDAVRDDAGRIVDFVLVDANQAALDYFRKDRDSLIGASIMATLPPQFAEQLRTVYGRTVETSEPVVVDGWHGDVRPGDAERYFDLRGVRVGDGISVSAREVTDRVLAAEALEVSERQAHDLAQRYEQARDAALEANAAKTAFLSRMSHELRTPLNAILGFAQLLELEQLTADQQDFVGQIRSGGRHLLGLVSEVLDVSRIESGTITLSMEPVSVADAIDQTLDLVRTQAMAAAVTVRRLECRGCVSHVWADRQRLIQVLVNLASNGIKYNHPGGSVEIGCAPGELGMVVIRVADTGRGLHPDQLSRLFEPFERLGAEQSAIEGTGIGLTLSLGLARAMGGRIEVESAVGEGSTFSLVIPGSDVDDDDAATDGTPVVHLPVGGLPVDVLYIEDNLANQHLMSHIVRLRPGATLRLAGDGAAGLVAAGERTPDLVLLDLHLPGIQGDEVLTRMRSDPVLARVPVVVVTADATDGLDQRLVQLGAAGVITKPIDVDHVLAWVDRAAERGL